MTNEVTLTLPMHAVRYLREMCKFEREALSDMTTSTFGPTLQLQAAYDSLSAIESELPDE